MNRKLSALDHVGCGGILIAALSCAGCFPALGALAATFGLGFLGQFEGVMVNTVLPLLAVLVLFINGYAWWQHRSHWRGVLSVLGPVAILASLYPLWQYSWSGGLFYGALTLMLVVSVMEFVKPVQARCVLPRGINE